MAITLTQLRSFLAVFRTGSVTGAADELVVTQPSVSAAVSALSRELEVDLGEAFAPYAADVIGLLDQGRRAAREAAETAAQELRIAAVTTAGEHIVPPLMEAFLALHPEIRLNVHVGNRQDVFERVRSHRSDLAIGGRPPGEGVAGDPFLDNPIVIITSPADPLAARRSVSIEEVARRPWLMREEGSGTRTMTEDFLAGHGVRPELLTLGSNGAIKQSARAGLGVAIQSRLAAQLELDLGLLATIDLAVSLPRREWYLLRPEHGPVRPPVEQFLAFARREGRRLVEGA
jgi:DNA-binding transcriptional LysR family regulator